MKILNNRGTAFSAGFVQFPERAGQFLPSILGAFLLLLSGWIVLGIVTLRPELGLTRR